MYKPCFDISVLMYENAMLLALNPGSLPLPSSPKLEHVFCYLFSFFSFELEDNCFTML